MKVAFTFPVSMDFCSQQPGPKSPGLGQSKKGELTLTLASCLALNTTWTASLSLHSFEPSKLIRIFPHLLTETLFGYFIVAWKQLFPESSLLNFSRMVEPILKEFSMAANKPTKAKIKPVILPILPVIMPTKSMELFLDSESLLL